MTRRVSSTVISAILGVTLVTLSGGGWFALKHYTAPPAGNFLVVGGGVPTMKGWADFCNEGEDLCFDEGGYETAKLTPALLGLMQGLTTTLRTATAYRFDEPGKDLWQQMYNGAGDCEDFAITMRSILKSAGVPARAMPIAIVDGPANAAPNPGAPEEKSVHAVLVVRTDQGDYVVDQVRMGVHLWWQTTYKWFSMESFDKDGFRSLGNVMGNLTPAAKSDRLTAISRSE